ncbi:MAG TPA: hypothetical protein DCF82_04720, partial [Marinobacter hydrocarbonoclasticus]|nr:hypothetical protein [Marinobacter nauticus]
MILPPPRSPASFFRALWFCLVAVVAGALTLSQANATPWTFSLQQGRMDLALPDYEIAGWKATG